jgi:hypothetical protein
MIAITLEIQGGKEAYGCLTCVLTFKASTGAESLHISSIYVILVPDTTINEEEVRRQDIPRLDKC